MPAIVASNDPADKMIPNTTASPAGCGLTNSGYLGRLCQRNAESLEQFDNFARKLVLAHRKIVLTDGTQTFAACGNPRVASPRGIGIVLDHPAGDIGAYHGSLPAQQISPRISLRGLELCQSGGHEIRTRNPLRGTTFPVWPLAIRLPSGFGDAAKLLSITDSAWRAMFADLAFGASGLGKVGQCGL